MEEPQFIVVGDDGKLKPPMAQKALFEAAATGHIHPTTKIQEVGHPVWFKASDHPSLSRLIKNAENTSKEIVAAKAGSRAPSYLLAELSEQYRAYSLWHRISIGGVLFGSLFSLLSIGFSRYYPAFSIILPLILSSALIGIAGTAWTLTQRNAVRKRLAELEIDVAETVHPIDEKLKKSAVIGAIIGVILALLGMGYLSYLSQMSQVNDSIQASGINNFGAPPVIHHSNPVIMPQSHYIYSVPVRNNPTLLINPIASTPQGTVLGFASPLPPEAAIPVSESQQKQNEDFQKLQSLQQQTQLSDYYTGHLNDRLLKQQAEQAQKAEILEKIKRKVVGNMDLLEHDGRQAP